MNTVDVITMGCSKNLVDSERIVKLFDNAGYVVRHNPENPDSDIIVINTCGFIGDAKEESIDMILECCQAKKQKRVRAVYVMGCLSERYREALPAEIPEVDGWYGKFDWTKLVADILQRDSLPDNGRPWDRTLSTPPHTAYIKVAEGCNRFCAFCAIPLITGRFVSRPIDEILAEVEDLVNRGVKEFNIIAQDLSSYGLDIYKKQALAELVDRMAQIKGVEWIRLHYLYPSQFPYDVLDVMAKRKNVCRYLDIALQHSSDKVLSNMRRHITSAETDTLLAEIRKKVPGIHLRTTLMVGFP
ncbi:MAG: MiaB/RimO family radical SAM methylthiotransferase, partial [Muribaculaceae bacterium]|nr:MiaB/RimO family radical SAM methylthiotransferase [Muribaculaceae bacterium]